MKVVLVTGGFDPLHSGHISYFESAKKLGDILVVGLNSDEWLTRKKGKPFMSFAERLAIIKALYCIDYIIEFNDDNDTAINALEKVKERYPDATIIFANGGDRTKENIPELVVDGVNFAFNVGNNKTISSSQLLDAWTSSQQ